MRAFIAAGLVAALIVGVPAVAMAQYPEPDHPNLCSIVRRDPDGSVLVQCRNAYTGAMWFERRSPNGDMSGTNAQGQNWTYDANRRVYENPQAGQRCIYSATGQRLCTN